VITETAKNRTAEAAATEEAEAAAATAEAAAEEDWLGGAAVCNARATQIFRATATP
jgi:hypothetical protein